MAACSYDSADLTDPRWATLVPCGKDRSIASVSLRLISQVWRFVFRIYVPDVTHNSRGFYYTYRDTTRDQYTTHDAITVLVGMLAHDEPRIYHDSDEAVCLQARSVRPPFITQDAVVHGAMSDATLSAWRAGLKPRPLHLPAHE